MVNTKPLGNNLCNNKKEPNNGHFKQNKIMETLLLITLLMIAEGPVAQSEPSHSDNNEAIQGTQVAHPNSEWSGKIGNEWNAQKD